MATTLYPLTLAVNTIAGALAGSAARGTNDAPDIATTEGVNGWSPKLMSTNRGGSAASFAIATVLGPTAGIAWKDSGTDPTEWISEPVDQDVTISGTITFNIRASEATMSANAAVNALVYKLDGKTMAKTLIVKTARTTELGTSEAANNFTATPTSTALNKGDRLILVIWVDDSAAATMAVDNWTLWYNGPTAAASGDTFVTFTGTFGFLTTSLTVEQLVVNGTAQGIGAAAGNEKVAQSFTVGGTGGECAKVEVWLDAWSGTPTDDLTLELRPDNAGVPSATVLATATVLNANLPNVAAFYGFGFSAAVTLSASTTYWIVLTRSGSDTGNFRQWDRAGASQITGGVKVSAKTPESWSDATNPTFDAGFRVHISPGTTLWLTDTDSVVDQSQVELEMWTARGGGVKNLQHYIQENTNAWVTPAVLDGGIYTNFDTQTLVAENGLRDPADRSAQSFVAKTTEVDMIRGQLTKTGTPTDNLVVEIQGDSGGNPDGVAIGTATKPATDSYAALFNLSFSSAVPLTRGSTYWVVFKRDGALSNVNYLSTRGTGGGGTLFPDGAAKYSDNSGGAWSAGTTVLDVALGLRSTKEVQWYTRPLTAFTLAGLTDIYLRVRDTVAAVGAGSANAELAVVNGDGSGATVVGLMGQRGSATAGYLAATETTYLWRMGVDDIAVTDGQRLRLRVFWTNDPGSPRFGGSGVTPWQLHLYYAGSAGMTGDSYIYLPQTVTEFVPAATLVLEQGYVDFSDPGVL